MDEATRRNLWCLWLGIDSKSFGDRSYYHFADVGAKLAGTVFPWREVSPCTFENEITGSRQTYHPMKDWLSKCFYDQKLAADSDLSATESEEDYAQLTGRDAAHVVISPLPITSQSAIPSMELTSRDGSGKDMSAENGATHQSLEASSFNTATKQMSATNAEVSPSVLCNTFSNTAPIASQIPLLHAVGAPEMRGTLPLSSVGPDENSMQILLKELREIKASMQRRHWKLAEEGSAIDGMFSNLDQMQIGLKNSISDQYTNKTPELELQNLMKKEELGKHIPQQRFDNEVRAPSVIY